jgi:hypothetical protein
MEKESSQLSVPNFCAHCVYCKLLLNTALSFDEIKMNIYGREIQIIAELHFSADSSLSWLSLFTFAGRVVWCCDEATDFGAPESSTEEQHSPADEIQYKNPVRRNKVAMPA